MNTWSSPPVVGTYVKNANNENGIITDIIDDYFVIVSYDNGSVESVCINHLFQNDLIDTNSESSTPTPIDNTIPINPDLLIHTDWDWSTPFDVNQRVILNPQHRNYDSYKGYVGDCFGTITRIQSSVYNSWILPNVLTKLVHVQWDNGFFDTFPVSSLLPVGNILFQPDTRDFKIGMKVQLDIPSSGFNNEIGYIVGVSENIVHLTFINDNPTISNSFFKKFLNIIDNKIYPLIKYNLEDCGYTYNISNEHSDFLDDIIIKRAYRILDTILINEENS